LILSNALRA
jgi:chromosome segregation ATPase